MSVIESNNKAISIRESAEANLFSFAKIVNPTYLYGSIHEKVFSWFSDQDAGIRQLLLLPRGHLKSHCIATWCSWIITKEPWATIIYVSAVDDLAKAQIYAIKNMMTSSTYHRYWPEMFCSEIGEREKWSAYAFNVDHPARKERGVRDSTLITKTIKSNTTGLHCDYLVFDDVVIPQNTNSEIVRNELNRSLGQFESILNPGGLTKGVGTRYHPNDAYQGMIDAEYPLYDEHGNRVLDDNGKEVYKKLWQVMEEVVEDSGDGTGNFLWPRTKCPRTGKWYGFNKQELAVIKAGYASRGELPQFYAQYYNNPNDSSMDRVSRDLFQYYEQKHLVIRDGRWFYKDNPLAVYACMDVAWTNNKRSDYTAIVVIGVDKEGFVYVLDIDRFQTDKFSVYYDYVISMHNKWNFRRLRVETNAGGIFVKNELENRIRQAGDYLIIDGSARSRHQGPKQERILAILEPKYASKSVFHFKGGLINLLEEEIIQANPKHDDLVDALASAMEISKPAVSNINTRIVKKVVPISRFGGRIARA